MGSDAERLNEFLAAYAEYVKSVLQPTQIEIRALLAPWQNPSYWTKYKRTDRVPIPTPVRTAMSRIKRPEQVVDKIYRKSDEYPDSLTPLSFERMRDALGVRILVYLNSHLPLIDRELRRVEWLEISETEPPVAYVGDHQSIVPGLEHIEMIDKESGYTSIHYTLRLRQSDLPEEKRPWFELQLRTLGQEWWGTMEHHLGYKPGKRTHMAAKRQFRVLSRMIGAIDEHFNLLHEELNRFQEETSYTAADPLNPENLPAVLSELGISCAQRDINNILKFLYSRGVETVANLRSLATPNRLDMIRNTYLAEVGRDPFNLEVIAVLAALRGIPGSRAAIRRTVLAQIAYRGAWDAIRQEFSDQG
jgi:putative GTP pyrophosphokinase